MDTTQLLIEAKARFNYKTAQEYLKEKYKDKFLFASQEGLWRADESTINFLNAFSTKKVILIDTFGLPREVDRKKLLDELKKVYTSTMKEFYKEWKTLEGKR